MMRVALVHNHSLTYMGGGETFIARLASALSRQGLRVSVYSLPIGRRGGVEVKGLLGGAEYREGLLPDVDADVAYVTYFPMASLALLRVRAPKVAAIHSPLLLPEAQDPGLFRGGPVTLLNRLGAWGAYSYYLHRVARLELRRFEAVHAYPHLVNFVRHRRVYALPPFIDVNRWRPMREKDEEFKVLFVGRRAYEKGFDVFTAVAREARKLGLKARFLATGGKEGEVIDGVESLGFVPEDELVNLYSSAHAVIYPTRADTFGLVILEALASGTPVVASDIPSHRLPGLPLLLVRGVDGALRQLIDLYNMFYNDRDRYLELCRRGREALVRDYSEEVVVPQYVRMFKEVAGLGP
ncbi:MAG: Glycosyltransferase [uncultured Acidilobus sp. JCHS]|nr:MAG: Glycosyltransferase [uncultured Acidilobus sp. JCHS]